MAKREISLGFLAGTSCGRLIEGGVDDNLAYTRSHHFKKEAYNFFEAFKPENILCLSHLPPWFTLALTEKIFCFVVDHSHRPLPVMDYETLKDQWSEVEDRDGVRLSWNTFPSTRMVMWEVQTAVNVC